MKIESIKISRYTLRYLDQRLLPEKEVWRRCETVDHGMRAISQLRVRGAPLIGVFAAYCIAVCARKKRGGGAVLVEFVRDAAARLNAARPTAVNLSWAVQRMRRAAENCAPRTSAEVKRILWAQARRIHDEDCRMCRQMGRYGAQLVKRGDRLLTHCNAGALATGGIGTALAVVYTAHRQKKRIHVYVDETRPLLQGARLTAWELFTSGVPCTLISDNMAAALMRQGKIDKIFVGADRIAANGDAANKIGTYSLAVLAAHHGIPFYVAAPSSTFDLSLARGELIPIEQRHPDEVRKVRGRQTIAPGKVPVENPAFDVTPAKYISALVTETGVIHTPNLRKITRWANTRKSR
ncbi:MAG: S-methyl-5-thioribose-1-phosphate isomerase [Candidatus Omnitrophica bacterium]|nr:S-methyl-5-thioribose-1-phosphate isomerase [Candidatus Omnitrophota bacterium]